MEIFSRLKTEIIIPVIELLFVLALIYFLWGIVQYVLHMNSPADRQTGQRHMFWGIVGLAIMLGAFGIVNLVFNSVTDNQKTKGINNQTIDKPTVIQGQGGF